MKRVKSFPYGRVIGWAGWAIIVVSLVFSAGFYFGGRHNQSNQKQVSEQAQAIVSSLK